MWGPALTCLVNADAGGAEAAAGHQSRDTVAGLHREGVVHVRLQITDNDAGAGQRVRRLGVVHAGLAGPALAGLGPALFTGDAVDDVLTAPAVLGGRPAQLHFGAHAHGCEVVRGGGRACTEGRVQARPGQVTQRTMPGPASLPDPLQDSRVQGIDGRSWGARK